MIAFLLLRCVSWEIIPSSIILAYSCTFNSHTHTLRISLRRRECNSITTRSHSALKIGIPACHPATVTVTEILFIAEQRFFAFIVLRKEREKPLADAFTCARVSLLQPSADREISNGTWNASRCNFRSICWILWYDEPKSSRSYIAFTAMRICDKCKIFRAFSGIFSFFFLFM